MASSTLVLPLPFAPTEVKAGESEIRAFDVAKVADQQTGERHYSLIGMTT